MTIQFSSICATQEKRSGGKNVASPTSERRPMNRSTGARTRSPTAIVHRTTCSQSDFPDIRLAFCRSGGSAVAELRLLRRLAQRRQLRRLGELLQGALLELRCALGREPEPFADGCQRLRLLTAGTE